MERAHACRSLSPADSEALCLCKIWFYLRFCEAVLIFSSFPVLGGLRDPIVSLISAAVFVDRQWVYGG